MAALSEVMARLSELHLHDTASVFLDKAEPDYFLHLDTQHSDSSNALLAATSTNNSIRIYNRQNLAYLCTIQGHEKPVTGVRFSPSDPNLLYTAALDGTIKCWDVRQAISSKKFSPSDAALVYEGYEETNNVFTAFDMSCDGRVLCAGTEAKSDDVHLLFWDCRKSKRLGVYSESHQDDITQVRFHPTIPDRLLSGSTDGLVCLFDIAEETEDDAMLQTFNADVAVNKVGYCGVDNSNVYCITTIESLHVWDTVEYDPVLEVTDIKDRFMPKLALDYIVDCFHLSPPSYKEFSVNILAGTHHGSLHVLEASPTSVSPCFALSTTAATTTRGHSALVRCMDWQHGSLVTGGEDGMVCSWYPEPVKAKTSSGLKAKSASKMRAKSSAKQKHRK